MKNNFLFSLTAATLLAFTLLAFVTAFRPHKGNDWTVPEAAKKVKNPVKATPENLKAGKILYDLHCKSCHGSKGKGDGTKAKSLNTSCGDFSTASFQSQTDGSIFYKIREGRDEMPKYKKKIPDENEVWTLVNYMRSLSGSTPKEEPKKPADDTKVTEKKETKKPADTVTKKAEVKAPVVKKDSATRVKDSLLLVEKINIEKVIVQMEKAINASDTLAFVALFTSDAIYMPAMEPMATGTEPIKAAVKKSFSAFSFLVKYTTDETECHEELAIVRATSRGQRTNRGIGDVVETSFENHYLLVMRKSGGAWKIYRLMSN